MEVLLNRDSLSSVSVACKMSWAARRQTTCVEDEAYSLMGIFGIHMTTIYGKGRRAFAQLQEDVMTNFELRIQLPLVQPPTPAFSEICLAFLACHHGKNREAAAIFLARCGD